MKRILSLVLALAATAFGALAQTAGSYTIGTFTGGTSAVNASTTATPGDTLAVSEFSTVGVQITLKASTTNTTAVTFKFAHSLDGSTYESTPSSEIEVTPNGVTEVSKVASISVPNTATLKLVSIVNNNANGYVTNIAVKVRLKASKVLTR
jgi:uncharacterized protein YxeA